MKILVVDDEKLLVKGIKFNLENDGYEVVTGCDGMEAVELAASESPDLIDRNELIALFEHIKEELRSEKDWIYPLEIPVLTDLVTNMPSAYRLDETIKRLEALAEGHPYKVPGNPDTYNQYNEAWQDCIGRAIDIVKGGGAE